MALPCGLAHDAAPMTSTNLPANPPNPPNPRRRNSAAHPGVSIHPMPPHPQTGAPRKLIRWRHPTLKTKSGKPKTREKVLVGMTAEDVRQWCIAQSKRNTEARTRAYRERVRYAAAHPEHDPAKPVPPPAVGPTRYPIVDACKRYLTELEKGIDGEDPASPYTLRNYDASLRDFIGWCRARGVTFLDELNVDNLGDYRAALVARRKPNGKPYRASSIEEFIKPVRTVCAREVSAQRALHLAAALASVLKQKRSRKARLAQVERRKRNEGGAYRLEQHEVRALLTAAIDYDARERRYKDELRYPRRSAAIDIALLLLLGLRCEEYAFLKCSAVSHARGHARLTTLGKGGALRTVSMFGFTHVGTELLIAATDARAAGDWLSENRYYAIGYHLRRICELYADRGVRECTPHDLRATTLTYQQALKVDVHRRAAFFATGLEAVQSPYERGGNTRDMSHMTYIDAPEGMPYDAESLEQAMSAEKEFRAVLRAYRAAPTGARAERRSPLAATTSGAFIAKSPLVLADALAPHPARTHARTRLPVPIEVAS